MPKIEFYHLQPSEKSFRKRLSGYFHKEAFSHSPVRSPSPFKVPTQVSIKNHKNEEQNCDGCWSIQRFLRQKAFQKATGVGKKCSLHPKAIPCTVKQSVGLFSRQHIRFQLERKNQGQSIKTMSSQQWILWQGDGLGGYCSVPQLTNLAQMRSTGLFYSAFLKWRGRIKVMRKSQLFLLVYECSQ